jgi:hypothetical protein
MPGRLENDLKQAVFFKRRILSVARLEHASDRIS